MSSTCLNGPEGVLRLLAAVACYRVSRTLAPTKILFEKKSHLLAKVLERTGCWSFVDPENAEVPVDPVLVRLALRSGLVRTDGEFGKALAEGRRLDADEAQRLRWFAMRAFKLVATTAAMQPYTLDDLLWGLGREVLRYGKGSRAIRTSAFVKGIRHPGALAKLEGLMDAAGAAGVDPRPNFPATWYF